MVYNCCVCYDSFISYHLMKKINLAVTGCMGRMGQQLIKSSKKNKLNIYDLNLKNKSVKQIIKLLKSINTRYETIGDYIISNHKLL